MVIIKLFLTALALVVINCILNAIIATVLAVCGIAITDKLIATILIIESIANAVALYKFTHRE